MIANTLRCPKQGGGVKRGRGIFLCEHQQLWGWGRHNLIRRNYYPRSRYRFNMDLFITVSYGGIGWFGIPHEIIIERPPFFGVDYVCYPLFFEDIY